MVKVKFFYQNKNISKVTVAGHANFAENGQDLVCAGISAIVIGTLNALHEMQKQQVKVITNSNLVNIEVKASNHDNQIILTTMLWQLKTISNQYQKNIKIEEV